jgi:Resolvase, N terminal domain
VAAGSAPYGDTVIVWRLDRLACSTRDLLETMETIQEAGTRFSITIWTGANTMTRVSILEKAGLPSSSISDVIKRTCSRSITTLYCWWVWRLRRDERLLFLHGRAVDTTAGGRCATRPYRRSAGDARFINYDHHNNPVNFGASPARQSLTFPKRDRRHFALFCRRLIDRRGQQY